MERIDSKLQRRQLELMKKRFDVDEENKIVTIDLYYDKVDDVLQSKGEGHRHCTEIDEGN